MLKQLNAYGPDTTVPGSFTKHMSEKWGDVEKLPSLQG